MAQKKRLSRMYFAIIIEDNDQGFHRESLWYGSSPENLGLMIIDVMKDWYEPNKDSLDESIIKYHEMLEDKDNLTFNKISNAGFKTNSMSMAVELSNDLVEMSSFILCEICDIYAKNGEKVHSFGNLDAFKEHFIKTYDIDDAFKEFLDGVTEISVSKALYHIDLKHNYTMRHFKNGTK